jgi:hypothetical protein
VHKKQEDMQLVEGVDAQGRQLTPPRMNATTFLSIFMYYTRAALPGTSLADVATPEMVAQDPLCDCGVCARAPAQQANGPPVQGVRCFGSILIII